MEGEREVRVRRGQGGGPGLGARHGRDRDQHPVRHGGSRHREARATAGTVLRLYLDRYKVEHACRLMKSGMGVDSVYVRTPKRADALLFVVAIATLASDIIDALLRRSGTCPFPTVKKAAEAIQHVSFVFHRSSDDRVFAYIDGIGLDPSCSRNERFRSESRLVQR